MKYCGCGWGCGCQNSCGYPRMRIRMRSSDTPLLITHSSHRILSATSSLLALVPCRTSCQLTSRPFRATSCSSSARATSRVYSPKGTSAQHRTLTKGQPCRPEEDLWGPMAIDGTKAYLLSECINLSWLLGNDWYFRLKFNKISSQKIFKSVHVYGL